MKPVKGEIVKGTDKSGDAFSEGQVTDNSATESAIRLSDGRDIYAHHEDIRPSMETPGS